MSNRWMDKQNVLHSYKELLLAVQEMKHWYMLQGDELWKHCAEWRQLQKT